MQSFALRVKQTLLPTIGWLFGLYVVFHAVLKSLYTQAFGDLGDGRFVTSSAVHWQRVFSGEISWLDPGFFYPIKDVLGFSDALFLHGVFATSWSIFEVNPYRAYMLALSTVYTLAYVSAYKIVSNSIKKQSFAVFGAVILTSSNGLSNAAPHSQLLAIWYLPIFSFLVLRLLKTSRKVTILNHLLILVTGLLPGLIFFTSYYVGWFAVLSAGIVSLLILVFDRHSLVAFINSCRRFSKTQSLTLLIGIAGGFIPFIATYLPIVQNYPSRSYSKVMNYRLYPEDLVNLGGYNNLWSVLISKLDVVDPWRIGVGEFNLAATPGLVLAAIIFALITMKTNKLALAFATAGSILAVLPIYIFDHTLWQLIWHVPGASAIRAIGRVELFANLVFAIAVIISLHSFSIRSSIRKSKFTQVFLSLAMVFILLEQVNSNPNASINGDSAFLEETTISQSIPAACEVFYLTSAKDYPKEFAHSLAIRISQLSNVHTIDGYSGLTPKNWELLDPSSSDTDKNAFNWLESNEIGLQACRLDLVTSEWTELPN